MAIPVPSIGDVNLATSSGVSGSDTFNFGAVGQNPWVGTIQRSDSLTARPVRQAAAVDMLAAYGPWALGGIALIFAIKAGLK